MRVQLKWSDEDVWKDVTAEDMAVGCSEDEKARLLACTEPAALLAELRRQWTEHRPAIRGLNADPEFRIL